jgi:hypothetical protein
MGLVNNISWYMADAFDFNELGVGMCQLNEVELSAIVHPSGDWFLIMQFDARVFNHVDDWSTHEPAQVVRHHAMPLFATFS